MVYNRYASSKSICLAICRMLDALKLHLHWISGFLDLYYAWYVQSYTASILFGSTPQSGISLKNGA